MTLPLDNVIVRSETYRKNCEVISRAHYLASDEFGRRHRQLGIPVLVASTIVGTTIFGTLQSNPDIWWRIATGLVSIGAALLAGLQTLLNFSEGAEKHKSAGASYSAIRRDFEIFQLKFQNAPDDQRAAAITALETLHRQLTKVGQETPNLPDRHWDVAYKEVHSKASNGTT